MKKGFFITLLVLVFFLILMLMLGAWMQLQQMKEEKTSVKIRVEAMHEFMKSAERDLGRFGYISMSRALFYATSFVIYNNTCLSNASASLKELMWNATINGAPNFTYTSGNVNITTVFAEVMGNATVSYWRDAIAALGEELGLDANIAIADFSVYQPDPWGVGLNFTAQLNVTDSAGVAEWRRSVPVSVRTTIEGYEDPSYPLNTGGLIFRRIDKGQFTPGAALVQLIVSGGAGGNGWGYGTIEVREEPNCCDCETLENLNKSSILVIHNMMPNLVRDCPAINEFYGIISEAPRARCKNGGRGNEVCNVNISKIYGMKDAVDLLLSRNGTKILMDGNGRRVLDIENVRAYVENGYYREANMAPDFLNRLECKLNASSQNGIESFVDIAWGSENRSYVDYYYLRRSNVTSWRIMGMPNCETEAMCNNAELNHFRLDNEVANSNASGNFTHLQYYGVSGLTVPN